MKVIHSLLAAIAVCAFAVYPVLAERSGMAKSSLIAGSAKKGITARALEQVRKGIPPSSLEQPGKGIAATPSDHSKAGIAGAEMGHARNRSRASGVQAIGGATRNAVGLRKKNEPAAGGKGPGPMALGPATNHLPGVQTSAGGQIPERAGIIPPAGTTGSRAPAGTASAPAMASGYGIHGGISGTGLVHIGSGPAVVGGPTVKNAGINGTSMRPKH